MRNIGCSPLLRNCSFQANSAASGQNGIFQDAGGAIYNEGSSSPVLINCSFQGNGASFGGAISSAGPLSPSLTNCVVWGNGGDKTFFNGPGALITTRYSFFESSVTGYNAGTGNLTATTSPFASSTDTRLAAGSVAINTGDPATTTATVGSIDLAGNARFYASGRIDMGAYELPTELTLTLFARPTTLYGQAPVSVVVDVLEVNGVTTYQPIILYLTKDAQAPLSFDATATRVGGRAVQNNQWSMAELPGLYRLTSQFLLGGGGKLSVGLTGQLRGGTSGVLTISGMLAGGSGGEVSSSSNNTDADKIEYFQQ